jgi:trehalose/maltose hydrolase-like predicted phosphorylase
VLHAAAGAQDSAFHLVTGDPARAPSPFIGNGRIGVVIPALGIGASNSFMAGLYENAPGDVPRIVRLPAWNTIAVSVGERWLDSSVVSSGLESYRQTLDMRVGTARTRYDWIDGPRRTTVSVETFVSRADSQLAAIRLELTPYFSGRMRVRFAIAGRPPPARLQLATLSRADPRWRPADVWYPGHMMVRSRAATRAPGGARLSLTATPEGRTIALALAAAAGWPSDLPGAEVVTRAAGDTALVEVAFDATSGRTHTFTHMVGFATSATDPNAPALASREAESAGARGWDALAADNALAWRRRWETDIEIQGNQELQRVVRSMLFYLLASAVDDPPANHREHRLDAADAIRVDCEVVFAQHSEIRELARDEAPLDAVLPAEPRASHRV